MKIPALESVFNKHCKMFKNTYFEEHLSCLNHDLKQSL